MSFVLGWLPFIINLCLLGVDLLWIYTLPISAIIGCVNVAVYYKCKKKDLDPDCDEYKYYDRKQKEWTGVAISGTTNIIHFELLVDVVFTYVTVDVKCAVVTDAVLSRRPIVIIV